jgi:hypothetical protein
MKYFIVSELAFDALSGNEMIPLSIGVDKMFIGGI